MPRLKIKYAQKHTIVIVIIAIIVAHIRAVLALTVPLMEVPVKDATTSLKVVLLFSNIDHSSSSFLEANFMIIFMMIAIGRIKKIVIIGIPMYGTVIRAAMLYIAFSKSIT